MFRKGQQVVCIENLHLIKNKNPIRYEEFINIPYKNMIYTIRGFVISGENTGILLEEIINPLVRDDWEPAFKTKWFRPVQKTDISIFTKMLIPNTKLKITQV